MVKEYYAPINKFGQYMFNNYEVSNFGNIRCVDSLQVLAQDRINISGYPEIDLFDTNKNKYISMETHVIVGGLLYLINPANVQFGHIDHDKTNNKIKNISCKIKSKDPRISDANVYNINPLKDWKTLHKYTNK
jgi:hypothetical protein